MLLYQLTSAYQWLQKFDPRSNLELLFQGEGLGVRFSSEHHGGFHRVAQSQRYELFGELGGLSQFEQGPLPVGTPSR